MATAPVKPPLHNFPLSFLKWGSKNHTNTNHRYRRPVSAEPEPPATDEDLNRSESPPPPQHHRVGSRTARHHRFPLDSCSEKLPLPPMNSDRANDDTDDEAADDDDAKAAASVAAAAEEAEVQKPWNLRPRRAAAAAATTAMTSKASNNEVHEAEKQSEPKSLRLRGLAAATEGPSSAEKKKEKRKFWIALSKDEIEEDIFIMTGSRPARRPKKRPKHVQKQLDNCFPGLWLVGFTADAYHGSDSPTKK